MDRFERHEDNKGKEMSHQIKTVSIFFEILIFIVNNFLLIQSL